MSRLEFRVAVETPRPGAALVMVAAATATLGITGQVSLLAVAVVFVSIALAWALSDRPHPLQRNRLLLNGGLAAIAGASLFSWVQGALAIEALAHFAMLAQGLQLLDARPRRSEFLLVALSLFQVVLAANLTDSMLFPPLLVVFAVTTVWTLMVHTIRAEALEAGDPAAARRVLSGGLLSMTVVASLVTILIAAVLFPLLPRVRSGAFLSAGFGGGLGVSGFSDRVELGDIGRIRMDPQIALRVETLEGKEPGPRDAYWRGLAFDHFDGRAWSVTPPERERLPGFAEIGLALGAHGRGARLEQQIVREPVISGVLFAAGKPLTLRGAVGRVERDVNGGVYAFHTASDRVAYRVVSAPGAIHPKTLERDRVVPPPGSGVRFLRLPELSDEVRALAREVTAGAGSDAGKLRALELHLRRTGRYTDHPPRHGEEDVSPVESFLLERTEGHCEYFASAMVVMARSLGMPARLVNGFAGGETNELGGFVEVRRSDAHTWVEMHYEHAGWVRYDPTPPDLRLAGAERLSGSDRLSALQSALEYWWFRNVIDFDRARQAQAFRSAWHAWHAWRYRSREQAAPERPETRGFDFALPTLGPPLLLGGAVLLAGLLLARRVGRVSRYEPPAYYLAALRLVARRAGLRRAASTTAQAYVQELEATLSARPVAAFARVTDLYLAERFGGRAAGDAGQAALRELRDSLRG